MMVRVAVSTGIASSVALRHAASPIAVRLIEQFDVVIRDHDGVVHHHPQHHDQRGDRHLVQFDAESVQQPEVVAIGNRNRHRGNQRHTERQQQHRHQDHRGDGDPELADKVFTRLRDHRGLVGNEIDLQVRVASSARRRLQG